MWAAAFLGGKFKEGSFLGGNLLEAQKLYGKPGTLAGCHQITALSKPEPWAYEFIHLLPVAMEAKKGRITAKPVPQHYQSHKSLSAHPPKYTP